MNVVEPGHDLTATPPDPAGLSTTVCECGWVSQPGTEAQPYLEARDHIPVGSRPQGRRVARAWLPLVAVGGPVTGDVLPGRRAAAGRPQGRP